MRGVSKSAFETLASFAAAIVFHGGLALALIVQPQIPGAGVRETAAISLNLIETQIIDAALQSPDQSSLAVDKEVDEEAGAQQNSAPSPARRETDRPDEQLEKRAPGNAADEAPRTEPSQKQEASKASKAQRKGGASSRAAAPGEPSSGAVSASRGAVNNYKGRVRARVASRRPRNVRGRGTAVVSFGISRSGGVRYVRLKRSSGSRSLDSAALSAIRRAAPFPRPPAGMSLRQLSFNIPFYFK